jgi:hypothetical protein
MERMPDFARKNKDFEGTGGSAMDADGKPVTDS